jgi:ABC-type oligopeptide transport system ATPase subunit
MRPNLFQKRIARSPTAMTTIRYTPMAQVLPETKMRLYPTKVINIIGGPGSGKSLIAAAIILYLHLHNKTVETIPDYAKSLVWQQNHEVLKNQYFIAQRQFEMLNLLDGQVQYLITECSLPQVLYYNENYADNICDIAKTRAQILEWYGQHDNANIFVERGDKKYVHTGRFQDEDQARDIDRGLHALLEREGLPFTTLPTQLDSINAFAASLLE